MTYDDRIPSCEPPAPLLQTSPESPFAKVTKTPAELPPVNGTSDESEFPPLKEKVLTIGDQTHVAVLKDPKLPYLQWHNDISHEGGTIHVSAHTNSKTTSLGVERIRTKGPARFGDSPETCLILLRIRDATAESLLVPHFTHLQLGGGARRIKVRRYLSRHYPHLPIGLIRHYKDNSRTDLEPDVDFYDPYKVERYFLPDEDAQSPDVSTPPLSTPVD